MNQFKVLYTCIHINNTYRNICGNIVNNTDEFNERKNTFFMKIYLSHFILERVDVGCVLHIDPKFFWS